MAESFRTVADRVEIREGGGALSLFGLPFLAAGIFVCLSAAGVVPLTNGADGSAARWPLMLLLGSLFTIVGGTLVFGRAWTTIDASRRELIKSWGLLWPMRTRINQLDDCKAVTIGFEHGDSDSADQFPILLKATDGTTLRLCSFRDYALSRGCATAIAGQLHIDLEDASTDHVQRMTASQAGVPLVQRSINLRSREHVAPPASVRSTVERDGDVTRLIIPKPRMHTLMFVAMLLPALFVFFVLAPFNEFFRRTQTPDPAGWMFLGFLLFGFGVLPASSALTTWLRSRLGRTIVTISSEGVNIQERGIFMVRLRAAIPSSEIVDLDYSTRESMIASARRATEQRVLAEARSPAGAATIGPRTEQLIGFVSQFAKGRGITIKTAQGLTTFGEGLTDDETQYLYEIIRDTLVR